MKNHIKNHIKIMGLAAVPFGTAQVHGDPVKYKVEVTKEETHTGWRFFIGAACIVGTELNQDCVRVEIALNKDENSVPCISYVSDGSCALQLLWGEVGNYNGVRVHRMIFYIKEKNIRSLNRVVLFRLYYCLSGGMGMDVGEVMASFCAHSMRFPADVSICVDSNIPVSFKGRFCSATTNNPTNKGVFFDHGASMFPYDRPVDKEDLKVIDMRIESREKQIEQMRKDRIGKKLTSKEKRKGDISKSFLERLHQLPCKAKKDEEPTEPVATRDRISSLFESDRARREKDPELEKERMRREKAAISARNRIREFIRIDLESRKIKESNKIEKNEIILEDPKVEDKKEEMSKVFFSKLSREDYFKGFDAFKENLSAEFEKNLKRNKSEKNEIKIEDKKSKDPEIFNSEDCFGLPESRLEFSEIMNSKPIKIEYKEERNKDSFEEEEKEEEDVKISQSEITFGNKSLAESIYNNKSSKKSGKSNKSDDEDSEKSDDRDSVSKLTLGSDFD